MMCHVLFVYYNAMGAVYVQSGKADGKIDPAQPDAVVGPVGMAPELGSGAVKVSDLTPEDMRKRMWWAKFYANARDVFARNGGKAALEAL